MHASSEVEENHVGWDFRATKNSSAAPT